MHYFCYEALAATQDLAKSTHNISKSVPNPATIDRSLYPYALDSKQSFDFASMLENLVFLEVLNNAYKNLQTYISVNNPNMQSIQHYLAHISALVEKNIQNLNCTRQIAEYQYNFIPCFKSLHNALQHFQDNLPNELKAWQQNAPRFYSDYLREQLRLAALFPKVTSEILTLNNNEVRGDEDDIAAQNEITDTKFGA